MSENSLDCVVAGAGVIGLAVARSLALAGRDVIVLESADSIGTEISARNSEVIHAGIYYPQNSLKAKLCANGKNMLYSYCKERGINHKICGKIIVADNNHQISVLAEIKEKAQRNGVHDLKYLNKKEAKLMEPELECAAALESPSSGLIDSHSLMLSFQGDLENEGGEVIFRTPITSAEITNHRIKLNLGGSHPTQVIAKTFINCTGLNASKVADRIKNFPKDKIPKIYYAKGNYFTLSRKSPFSRLIYPIPEESGLGIHLTLDLGGMARFGPDVEWVDKINYDVDPKRSEIFYNIIRRYWPALPDNSLQPGYAGIRPKLQSPDDKIAKDFMIQGPKDHGVEGIYNLFGIESPGLTSSLAIAEYVNNILPKD